MTGPTIDRASEIEIVVVGTRCVYIGNHRVAGGKPYVSENLPERRFKSTVGEILSALGIEENQTPIDAEAARIAHEARVLGLSTSKGR